MSLDVSITAQIAEVSYEASSSSIGFGSQVVRELAERDPYTGSYTITPGDSAITLNTAGKRMTGDLSIAPVPSGYGKITWNGSYLTVS